MRSEDLSLPDTSGSDPAVGVSRPADLSHPVPIGLLNTHPYFVAQQSL